MILRYTQEEAVEAEGGGGPVTMPVHVYPCKTLPIIKSHLHPKFAIVNAGEKMYKLLGTNLEDAKRVLLDFPILKVVMDVYTAWTRVSEEDLSNKSFNDPPVSPLDLIGGDSPSDDNNDDDNNNSSDYDNRTAPYRPRPPNRKTQNSVQGSYQTPPYRVYYSRNTQNSLQGSNRTPPYRPHPPNRKTQNSPQGSYHTPPCRAYYSRKMYWKTQNSLPGSPVRKRRCIESAPQASGSKRKVLSEFSLFKHHQQIGARHWTGNRICKWDRKNWRLVAKNQSKKVCDLST